jgi:hypothetical protein
MRNAIDPSTLYREVYPRVLEFGDGFLGRDLSPSTFDRGPDLHRKPPVLQVTDPIFNHHIK